jgi:hypothetical protein
VLTRYLILTPLKKEMRPLVQGQPVNLADHTISTKALTAALRTFSGRTMIGASHAIPAASIHYLPGLPSVPSPIVAIRFLWIGGGF